jgi:hypothetical protein
MATVYLLSSAKDVLQQLDPDERDALRADLQKLTEAPAVKAQIGPRDYEAVQVSDGWVAVYRDLEPDEPGGSAQERTIAVMDLVRPDKVKRSWP